MALKKPLVLTAGQIEQLQAGDSLDAVASEVDAVSLVNANASPIVIGSPVYSSAPGSVNLAKADASGTVQVVGLVRAPSITNAQPGSVQMSAVLVATTTQWDAVAGTTGGLTAGTVYYLDPTTAGKMTATPPSTAGQFVVRLGIALSTTEFDISIQPPMKL